MKSAGKKGHIRQNSAVMNKKSSKSNIYEYKKLKRRKSK